MRAGPNPAPRQFPACAGVFVGGCVSRGIGSSFRAKAHAHTSKHDRPYWICVRSLARVYNADGSLSALLWHEYAHILIDEGHTAKWRAKMIELGQPLSDDPRRGRGTI